MALIRTNQWILRKDYLQFNSTVRKLQIIPTMNKSNSKTLRFVSVCVCVLLLEEIGQKNI